MNRWSILLWSAFLLALPACDSFNQAINDSFGGGESAIVTKADDDVVNDPADNPKNQRKAKETEYVLFFHRIPTGKNSGLITADAPIAGSNETILLEKTPFCYSKFIDSVYVVPSQTRPGFYGFFIHLDQPGRRYWESFSGLTKGTPAALVIDGKFHRSFVVDKFFDSTHEEWAYIDANLSRRYAEKIAAAAAKNYRVLSKNPMSLWDSFK